MVIKDYANEHVLIYQYLCTFETEDHTESFSKLMSRWLKTLAFAQDFISKMKRETLLDCKTSEHRGSLRCIHGDAYRFLISLFLQGQAHIVPWTVKLVHAGPKGMKKKRHGVQLEDRYSNKLFSQELGPLGQEKRYFGEDRWCESDGERLPLHLTLLSFCHRSPESLQS